MRLEVDDMEISGVQRVNLPDRVVEAWLSPNNRYREIRMDVGERVGYKIRGHTSEIGSEELQLAVDDPEKFKERAEADESVRLMSVVQQEEGDDAE